MKDIDNQNIMHPDNLVPIIKQPFIEDLILDHQQKNSPLESLCDNDDDNPNSDDDDDDYDDDGFEDELSDQFHDSMRLKINDVNAQFAADPTPIESDRLRYVTFKDNLVDIAPHSPPRSPDFLEDTEIDEKNLEEIIETASQKSLLGDIGDGDFEKIIYDENEEECIKSTEDENNILQAEKFQDLILDNNMKQTTDLQLKNLDEIQNRQTIGDLVKCGDINTNDDEENDHINEITGFLLDEDVDKTQDLRLDDNLQLGYIDDSRDEEHELKEIEEATTNNEELDANNQNAVLDGSFVSQEKCENGDADITCDFISGETNVENNDGKQILDSPHLEQNSEHNVNNVESILLESESDPIIVKMPKENELGIKHNKNDVEKRTTFKNHFKSDNNISKKKTNINLVPENPSNSFPTFSDLVNNTKIKPSKSSTNTKPKSKKEKIVLQPKHLPKYNGNARSQYGLSKEDQIELKKKNREKLLQTEMKEKQLKLSEIQKREEAKQAYEAWLERKKTEVKVKHIQKKIGSNEQKPIKEWKDTEKAFQAWLKRKEGELHKNQILEKLQKEEANLNKHKASRHDAEKAFKRWLQKKQKEENQTAKMSTPRQQKGYLNSLPLPSNRVEAFTQTFYAYLGNTM